MKSEPYTGTVTGMKGNTPWLASEDILGLGDVAVTIEAVVKNEDVVMDGGRREKQLFSLRFKGKEKAMILNSTNRKTLSSGFGADTKKWLGQTIKIYAETGIRKPGGKQGETCTGLRIRPIVGNNPLLGGGAQ